MNHKWRKGELPQLCERCGILRQRKTFRLLMAITDHPPYNHYLYETKIVYTGIEMPTTTKRPECIKTNQP